MFTKRAVLALACLAVLFSGAVAHPNHHKCSKMGAYRCVGTGFQICGPTHHWTSTQACGEGTVCEQQGSTIACVLSKPTPCKLGSYKCSGKKGFQACIQTASGTTTYAAVQECAAGTVCKQKGSTIECVRGHRRAAH